MPQRRRKLNKDFEKSIAKAKKEIELITAKIHDIYDEDIQGEYKTAFALPLQNYIALDNSYKKVGFNEDVVAIHEGYKQALAKFLSEYEI